MKLYYKGNDGGTYGPVSAAELKNLTYSGTFSDDNLVSDAPDGEWCPFRDHRAYQETVPEREEPSRRFTNAAVGHTRERLVDAGEVKYQRLVVAASILLWIAVALTIVGPVYAGVMAFFIWFANGLFTAHLRSGAVEVSPAQLPELYASFHDVCHRLGLRELPRLYIIESGGALNAFATRHSGRDFVVLYADFLDAFSAGSNEVKFVLGHEVGHIRRNHILKQLLLFPGRVIPLLGNAYSRACESTCDRYGAFAADDADASIRAMMTLSGGKGTGRAMDAKAYAAQYHGERGFFVSLHELTSGYPTLSRRVEQVICIKEGRALKKPRRHPLAYLFALFTPGGQAGGGAGSMLLTVFMIGLIAAMAIPAFHNVRETAHHKQCMAQLRQVEAAAQRFVGTRRR